MRSRTTDVSLFDVEDSDDMPPVREMTIDRVTTAEVREFCARYHHTGHSGYDQNRWGLWYGAVLLGVVSYNNGSRSAAAAVFGEEHAAHVWHMGRLAVADRAPRNSESRLIGGSLQAIKATRPDVWAVITYADTGAGHVGYVYQATNAIYTGAASAHHVNYRTPDGRHVTDRPVRRSLTRVEATALGWTPVSPSPKHRYVYLLGTKNQRRHRSRILLLPSLPYPKHDHTGKRTA